MPVQAYQPPHFEQGQIERGSPTFYPLSTNTTPASSSSTNPFVNYQQPYHTSPQAGSYTQAYYTPVQNTVPPLNRPYENSSSRPNNYSGRQSFQRQGKCFNCGKSNH